MIFLSGHNHRQTCKPSRQRPGAGSVKAVQWPALLIINRGPAENEKMDNQPNLI